VRAVSSAVTDVLLCWFGVVEMVLVLRNPQSAATPMARKESQDKETYNPKVGSLVP
jgi:hypothetical protein